ncbi:MAG: quinol:cytochrome C oxidoreductase, partial [Ignavibacteria bacterium]
MSSSMTQLAETTFVKKLQMAGIATATVGIVLSIVGVMTDMHRFLFDYLIAFVFWGGIAVTAVFFSMLQFLTRSGWSTAVRRIPELLGGFTPFLLVLLLPIVFGVGELYHHWVHPEAGDVVMAGKQPWLNTPFFIIRLFVYVAIWIGMYFFIVGNSIRQDSRKDITLTRRNWKFSAPITIFYGITITFAAFDLLMSLYPHWFSTIFGVYYFAGSLVGALAVITLVMIMLRRAGLLSEWLTMDRFHDLGKLLFAFNVFWAYIAFSQYLLIWYADLPE